MNKRVLITTGLAGAGKDFFLELIKEGLKKENIPVEHISFARKFKEIISTNLPPTILEQFPEMKPLDLLDYLKNERDDFIIYQDDNNNLNMREFLKKLLGETVRGIEKDIHAIFEIEYIYQNLKWNPEAVFMCSDNRYPNEQDYIIGFNSCKNNEERINYCESVIFSTINNLNLESINNKFNDDFSFEMNPTPSSFGFIQNIKQDFIDVIKSLREIKPIHESSEILNKVSLIDFTKLTQEDFFNMGIVNIFRPALPDSYVIDPHNTQQLIDDISEFSKITKDAAETLLQRYQTWGIDLNKLHDYGICRANPEAESEKALRCVNRSGYKMINKGDENSFRIQANRFVERFITPENKKLEEQVNRPIYNL